MLNIPPDVGPWPTICEGDRNIFVYTALVTTEWQPNLKWQPKPREETQTKNKHFLFVGRTVSLSFSTRLFICANMFFLPFLFFKSRIVRRLCAILTYVSGCRVQLFHYCWVCFCPCFFFFSSFNFCFLRNFIHLSKETNRFRASLFFK